MNLSNINVIRSLPKVRLSTGIVYWVILLSALIAFEFFNYSTTEFALRDLEDAIKNQEMELVLIKGEISLDNLKKLEEKLKKAMTKGKSWPEKLTPGKLTLLPSSINFFKNFLFFREISERGRFG